MALSGFHHVAYRCKDAKETVEWYQKYLDIEFVLAFSEDQVPSTKEPDPYMHVFLDVGGGNVLAFFELPTQPEMGRDPNTPEWVQHIAMKVESMAELKAAHERLVADGHDVLGPIDHTLFQSIYFFDPNGHRLELAFDTATPEMGRRLDEVKWDMLNEWAVTKKAPRHADWLHQREFKEGRSDVKLASLKEGRDGRLVVVSRDLTRAVRASGIAETLQQALDDWDRKAPALAASFPRSWPTALPRAPSISTRAIARRPCRAPFNGPTGRPMSIMSRWCARRAAPKCRKVSGASH